jgi:hypothetical protein
MKLYVIRSSDGKYFRPVGYGGYGDSWQENIEKAKFYTKIGPAKSQCTFWYGAYPKFGCPVVLEFDINPDSAIVLPMIENAQKSIDKKNKKIAKRKEASKVYTALTNKRKIRELIPTLSQEQRQRLGI